MSSSTAKLGNGPWALECQRHYSPLFTVAFNVLSILDADMSTAWAKPAPQALEEAWATFLQFRQGIIASAYGWQTPEGGLAKYSNDLFYDARGRLVSMQEAQISFLRSLPMVLVPPAASRYLPAEECATAQAAFAALEARVTAYFKDYAQPSAESPAA